MIKVIVTVVDGAGKISAWEQAAKGTLFNATTILAPDLIRHFSALGLEVVEVRVVRES